MVLAGDVGVGLRGVEWAARHFADRPVVYVPGNHEFYGQAYPRFLDKLRTRGREVGVQVLAGEVLDIDGVRFLGSTLWTDFRLIGESPAGAAAAEVQMADFKRIRVEPTYRKLRPQDTVMWHQRSRRWLEKELAAGPASMPRVVVTQHAPSARSLNPLHASDPVSTAYASALDDLVAASGARYWIHGHTHHCVDYLLGDTRVVSNQRGYPDEPVSGFDPALVLEI